MPKINRRNITVKSGFLTVGILALSVYGLASLGLASQQRQLIFRPTAEIKETPADYQVRFEPVVIPVPGSATGLAAWWIPAARPEAPVILYCHGNYANIGANAEHAARFHRLGYHVLLFDYRGYGQSQGNFPSESQVYEDASAAWSYVRQQRQIPPERIVIYGHSLGGAIAIHLAREQPQAAGLIVESSFTSIVDLASQNLLYRLFALEVLVNQRFESERRIRDLKMPLLVLHGTADQDIPDSMGQRLFAAAPDPKRLVLIPGAGHDNSAVVGGSLYLEAVSRFVQSLPSR